MSAFTKRQPDEGQGASSGWLPGCLSAFAGNLHQLAFRGWSTNGHGQIFLTALNSLLLFPIQFPLYVHYFFTAPTLQSLDITMPDVPSQ